MAKDAREITREDFAAHRGEVFHITPQAGEDTEAELVEVTGHARNPDAPREPFSLVFRTTGEHGCEQQICTVRHEALGELALFLVPLGPDGEGRMRYEAVFT